jgi:hypothetical protein
MISSLIEINSAMPATGQVSIKITAKDALYGDI